MSYIIRKAVPADTAAITNCIKESFQKYIPLIHKEPEPMILDYSDVIREKSVFVLEDESEIVGALVLDDGDNSVMWLDVLGVYSKYQSRGYGKILIEFGEGIMREQGAKESRVLTNISFENTIGIYKHLGYKEYERKQDHGYERVFLKKEL